MNVLIRYYLLHSFIFTADVLIRVDRYRNGSSDLNETKSLTKSAHKDSPATLLLKRRATREGDNARKEESENVPMPHSISQKQRKKLRNWSKGTSFSLSI